MRAMPGLLGSVGENRELPTQMGTSCQGRCRVSGRYRRTRFHLRMVRLGKMLADSPPGRCFACTRTFSPSGSTARMPESFCSEVCEAGYLRKYFASANLSECDRVFRLLTELLGKNGSGS